MTGLRGFTNPRRLLVTVLVTATWCALWADLSIANIASGILIGVVITSAGIGTEVRGSIRVVPLAQLGWLVLLDLVASTVSVAREVLTPTDYTEEGIIAVRLPVDSRRHLLLLTVAITVTPGTAVVDVDPDTSTFYLHLLHIDKRDEVAAHAIELAELACRGLPTTTTWAEAVS